MKKIIFSFFLFCTCLAYTQKNANPLVILDAKNIGYMSGDAGKILEPLNPDTISTLIVYKDSISKNKYNSNSGVIVITTKAFILDSFYKNFISNSNLKSNIKTPDDLLKIGVVTGNPDSKNQPYDELIKYIDTDARGEKVKKIAGIFFIKPSDAKKINSKWEFGAIEITSEKEF